MQKSEMSRSWPGKGAGLAERSRLQMQRYCNTGRRHSESYHLTCLLSHSLEAPPSYKPPVPKAKLEEPEMVSASLGAQAIPAPYPPFPTGNHLGGGWQRETAIGWGGGVLTCPPTPATALPALHSGGLGTQPAQDPLL
jgi:hypothetical protein